jgi:predicted RNase H-like nuclease (RuvC/YqgF family)
LTQLHDEWWERVQDANKQLAAERERYVKIESQLKAHSSALEAEREKSQKLVEYGVKLDDWNDKLQEQLAAEREKVENLRYALAKMEGK